ncbi:hypothetical protein MY04_2596 [Flammeovirga sp. MY04]|uniref:hypothetical protein n=1 Tax=Flammeovirga sp. MY04 TaxID=1191459 RepID=UPI00080641FA|nr:hypothetical protein [Flammeovirga sp. MY04]ANQ49965.1 hypothetical protein MY04_2596 [Flammeovirga sp. MY04]
MTANLKANVDRELAFKRISQNDQKSRKWKKASDWLREQMIDWEIKHGESV